MCHVSSKLRLGKDKQQSPCTVSAMSLLTLSLRCLAPLRHCPATAIQSRVCLSTSKVGAMRPPLFLRHQFNQLCPVSNLTPICRVSPCSSERGGYFARCMRPLPDMHRAPFVISCTSTPSLFLLPLPLSLSPAHLILLRLLATRLEAAHRHVAAVTKQLPRQIGDGRVGGVTPPRGLNKHRTGGRAFITFSPQHVEGGAEGLLGLPTGYRLETHTRHLTCTSDERKPAWVEVLFLGQWAVLNEVSRSPCFAASGSS